MEAVAVFSLACNVVQIVETSIKAAAIVQQTYKEGSSKDNEILKQESQSLTTLSEELTTCLKTQQTHSQVSKTDWELRQIASDCQNIVKDLTNEIKALEASKGTLGAFRKGFRAVRKKAVIESLQKRLNNHEARLNTAILVSLRSQHSAIVVTQQQQFENLESTLKTFIINIANGQTQVTNVLKAEGDATRQLVVLESERIQSDINAQFEHLRLSSLRTQLLTSLDYPDRNSRFIQIVDAGDKTFEWILDEDQTTTTSWSSFTEWLSNDEKLFWIQGKAGSGKSTLMKYIWENDNVRVLLQKGRGLSKEPVLLRFCFWLSGSPMQRSLPGLLASLLHQLLCDIHDSVIGEILSTHPSIERMKNISDWSNKLMLNVLILALQKQARHAYVLIFLDGLDELDVNEEPAKLMKMIQACSAVGRVKVCLSSRPEPFWRNQLASEPQLRLQDLTASDIYNYVSESFDAARLQDELPPTRIDVRSQLIKSIVDRADGVFLWVHLAIRHILRGLDRKAGWDELQHSISILPRGLEKLYEDMLNRVAEDHKVVRQEAALYLKLVLLSESIDTGYGYCGFHHAYEVLRQWKDLPHSDNMQIRQQTLVNECWRLKDRVPDICAGLLDVEQQSSVQYRDKSHHLHPVFGEKEFVFSHRTVRDFLIDIPAGRSLIREAPMSKLEILHAVLRADTLPFKYHHSHLTVGFLTSYVYRYIVCQQIYAHEITESDLCDLLEHLENDISAMVCKANLSADSSCQHIFCSRVEQDFEYSVFREPDYDSIAVCVDFTGLLVIQGFWPYVEHSLSKATMYARPGARRMTKQYMSYISLCGSQGTGWHKMGELMNSGVDIFKYFYPNARFPIRQSPATRIVRTLIGGMIIDSSRISSVVPPISFLRSMIASKTQGFHHALFRLQSTYLDSSILSTVFTYTNSVVVEIEILSFLSSFLVAIEDTSRIVDPKYYSDQMVSVLNTSMRRIVLVCRDNKHCIPSTEALERVSSSGMFKSGQPSLLPQVIKEICPIAFSEDRQAYFEEQIEILFNSSTVDVDPWEYVKEIGYGKERSDPEILRWPIQKFEDVEEGISASKPVQSQDI